MIQEKKLKSQKGSSIIEAALIFPIIILIIIGILKISLSYYEKITEIPEKKLIISYAEIILRGRRALK